MCSSWTCTHGNYEYRNVKFKETCTEMVSGSSMSKGRQLTFTVAVRILGWCWAGWTGSSQRRDLRYLVVEDTQNPWIFEGVNIVVVKDWAQGRVHKATSEGPMLRVACTLRHTSHVCGSSSPSTASSTIRIHSPRTT
jgi:hypothetical protein